MYPVLSNVFLVIQLKDIKILWFILLLTWYLQNFDMHAFQNMGVTIVEHVQLKLWLQ